MKKIKIVATTDDMFTRDYDRHNGTGQFKKGWVTWIYEASTCDNTASRLLKNGDIPRVFCPEDNINQKNFKGSAFKLYVEHSLPSVKEGLVDGSIYTIYSKGGIKRIIRSSGGVTYNGNVRYATCVSPDKQQYKRHSYLVSNYTITEASQKDRELLISCEGMGRYVEKVDLQSSTGSFKAGQYIYSKHSFNAHKYRGVGTIHRVDRTVQPGDDMVYYERIDGTTGDTAIHKFRHASQKEILNSKYAEEYNSNLNKNSNYEVRKKSETHRPRGGSTSIRARRGSSKTSSSERLVGNPIGIKGRPARLGRGQVQASTIRG
tara:strand:- start:7072 stop:8025 length:954 start_codon:yes stop_codon:yes gene_type:complete